MKKEQRKDILLKVLATQIMLTEQAIIRGECLIDGINSYTLSEHVWEETAIHAQLVTIRRRELKEYQQVYAFLSEKSEKDIK